MSVSISYVTVGKWETNAYKLEVNGESIIIDPGDEFEKLDESFRSSHCVNKCILNTHGHFDHMGAVKEFKEKYQIPFYLHSKDIVIMRQANIMRKFAGISGFIQIPTADYHLDDVKKLTLGRYDIKVFHTPGHTPGSVAFEIENNLIAGDLIFKDSIGRSDLPGGNKELMKKTLHFVFERFRGYTIYPGHGEPFILTDEAVDQLMAKL